MLHRFDQFEVDENARVLRGGGRVATPQPRVFDLIVYLVRHRGRVVPKEELLEKLWPDVIVTDASLQRAVSLARSVCAELGAVDAIRNYARQGYRFELSEASQTVKAEPRGMTSAVTNPDLLKARAAYAAAKWEEAIAGLHAVDVKEGLCAEDLQCWANAAQSAGWMPEIALPLERAVAAYAARGDPRRAGWVAVLLSQTNLEQCDAIAARGWLNRAARLLEVFPDTREYGYVSYLQARLGMLENDFEPALVAARCAHEAGRRHGDPDLEYLGLLFVGELEFTLGRVEKGVALLDEAGVAVRSSSISPQAGSIIYCGVISISMLRADWERAGRWAEVFQGWCSEHGSHALPGLCRLHQAEVHNVRGALSDAHREVETARAVLASRSPWAEGEAWRVLGEIHFGRGDAEAAEAAFLRAHEYGWDTQPGLALLEMERGNLEQALRLIVRGLEEKSWSMRQRRGLLLAHSVVIASRAGDQKRARQSLAELDENPALWSTSALRALVTCARGEIAAAERKPGEAIASIRGAIQQWHAIESPLPAARARCRLAQLLAAENDIAAAEMEFTAAISAFERAGAVGALARCQRARETLRNGARKSA